MDIRPLTIEAARAVLADLRTEDLAELEAAGVSIEDFCAALPDCSGAAVFDGALPFCIFGVRPLGDAGVPWMVATPRLCAHRRQMLKVARRELADMHREFSVLVNLVHTRNAGALRFLRRLGFAIGAAPMGPGGQFILARSERNV